MTPDQICSFVAYACCCKNCGEVFDSANHPHTDADCDKGYALWEVADQEMIAARLHRHLSTSTASPRIAELEAKVEELRRALVSTAAHLMAAISLLEGGGEEAAWSDKVFEQMLNDYKMSLAKARAALAPKETDE